MLTFGVTAVVALQLQTMRVPALGSHERAHITANMPQGKTSTVTREFEASQTNWADAGGRRLKSTDTNWEFQLKDEDGVSHLQLDVDEENLQLDVDEESCIGQDEEEDCKLANVIMANETNWSDGSGASLGLDSSDTNWDFQ